MSEEGIHRPHVAGIAGSAKVSLPRKKKFKGGIKSGNIELCLVFSPIRAVL